jgi:hypothetical protein
VIGTLVWDRVRHPSGGPEPVEQWGGITYSLAALSAAPPPGWSVEPVLKIGEDMAAGAEALLARFDGLTTGAGLLAVPEATNRVELIYSDAHRRGERLTGGVPSWEWDELRPRLDGVEAIYLNFISGFEIELATAERLRGWFSGPIYADLHSLFLGCPGGGVREQRVPPRWEEWLPLFDLVQMNETELALLAGERSPDGFAASLLARGPSVVAVTRGGRGAMIEARASDRLPRLVDHPVSLDVPVPGGLVEGDPTGCGDVWGATFFAGLLGGLTPSAAAERAHLLALAKLAEPSTARLHRRLRAAVAPMPRA